MARLPYHHDVKLAYQIGLGLRVHWFGRYAGFPKWTIPTTRLAADMLCFFFVEKGNCWVTINGRRLTLQPGDLLLILGGDEFSFGHNPAKPHVSTSACLALEQGSIANTLLRRKFERRYPWSEPKRYIAEFGKVLAAFAGRLAYRDLDIAGALLHWLAYVMLHLRAPLDPAFAHERNVVDKILAAETWANSRLKRPILLADWAKSIGLNPVYFGRIFKRETGLRPMEWVIQRRLQMASQYLSGTSKSIVEIAEDCGFGDQFYFSRVFRKHFGQSPLQYRKRRF